MQELWDGFIDFTAKLVVPDWNALVGLIPLGVGGLVALFLLWSVARAFRAPPRRRGVRRLTPVAPPGVHLPGPTFAPVLGAIGTFLLFFGIIAGGLALWLGVIALVLTLLYWGREAITDYEHIPDVASEGGSLPMLPEVAHAGPPPGIHMPGPSFRPILGAIGATVLLFGFVAGGPLLIAGAVVIVITLIGWLFDAGREFRATEAADLTGHIENGPAPRWPRATLAAVIAIVVVAGVLASGFLPIGRGEAGASGAPGSAPPASQAPGGGGEPSAPPASGEAPPDGAVVISAANAASFEQTAAQAPGGAPFTIHFENKDSLPHNVALKDGAGAIVFNGEIFAGPGVRDYQVPALAPGDYQFFCAVHTNMTGTLTAS